MFWVEVVFMMLVLKLPVLYVAWLVWWAVRAVPEPLEGAALLARTDDDPGPHGWWSRRLGRSGPRSPHGRPARVRRARAGEPRVGAKGRR